MTSTNRTDTTRSFLAKLGLTTWTTRPQPLPKTARDTKQLTKTTMNDSDYQAGMTAAIKAYQASVQYPVSDFSYTYTPAPTQILPETVTVTF